ncbi:alpha-L-fucosidase [Marinilongibacter aquaticus]|uniref:alpha-L-fucosidase n=1 Tax=Marinilongibacter aquaticus TaxID=2975157 RepID=UPI0021BD7D86|nr:alpha-L-fucosidase [Marinilongibacter aquaticus]UBM59194.1 alpha-L-fucosidase [Marinilongibacter aquaticus]
MKKRIICVWMLCTVCIGQIVQAQSLDLPMAEGPFKPSDASLQEYAYPEWFRDAKFGIWSHWGPQAVPRQGDWYARNMYIGAYKDKEGHMHEASEQYQHHLEHYGHPSKFGYKDIIPLWKAERWNPEKLMKLYKRVGAKYFVSMGTHHDNFFLWNSKLNKWNAVNMGPKKDVVGLWQKAAKKEGLFFGVSEHLGASYTWYQKAHQADQLGEMAGVPYDGQNSAYWDLYHEPTEPGDTGWYTNNPKFQKEWYDRIRELIDNYHPDLLYSDGALPFGNDVGRSLIAHYYNQGAQNGVVYNCKERSDGRWVADFERGSADGIQKYPWQTDTSIGDWYYRTGQKYKSAKEVVQMLVDIVSKNGNLLLNVVQTPEGDLEKDVLDILEGIALWMDDNGEAIYGTRPWKVFGEGPSLGGPEEKSQFHHIANAVKDVREYLPGDLRFTIKGNELFVFNMEKSEGPITIKSLGLKTATGQKVKSVKLLGSKEKIEWTQNDEVLRIEQPKDLPKYDTAVFALELN